MDGDNKDFSEDMMVEILSRLPVKSLMRMKCVSKILDSLIKSPIFIAKHLKNNDEEKDHLLVINLYGVDPQYTFFFFQDRTLSDLTYEDLAHRIPSFSFDDQRLLFAGPFDGLFCIYGMFSNEALLWNFASRETRYLPEIKPSLPDYTEAWSINVGFHSDFLKSDYKLILIRNLWDDNEHFSYIFTHVSIYTLSTGDWRDFKADDLSNYTQVRAGTSDRSMNIDGVSYWVALRSDDQVILSFDMDEEVFRETNQPFISYNAATSFGYSKNYPSLLILDNSENFFDIWVMKHRSTCWIKQSTIEILLPISGPINFWKDDTFFLRSKSEEQNCRGRILLYDPITKELRKDFEFLDPWSDVYKYKESLILLDQDHDNVSNFSN